MLVLMRHRGERVRIGENIRVTVVRDGNRVRLGFEAPREVNIVREELVDTDFDVNDGQET